MWCRNKGRRIKKKNNNKRRPSVELCCNVYLCAVCLMIGSLLRVFSFHRFLWSPYIPFQLWSVLHGPLPSKKCLQCLFVLLLLIRGFCFCFFCLFFSRENFHDCFTGKLLFDESLQTWFSLTSKLVSQLSPHSSPYRLTAAVTVPLDPPLLVSKHVEAVPIDNAAVEMGWPATTPSDD